MTTGGSFKKGKILFDAVAMINGTSGNEDDNHADTYVMGNSAAPTVITQKILMRAEKSFTSGTAYISAPTYFAYTTTAGTVHVFSSPVLVKWITSHWSIKFTYEGEGFYPQVVVGATDLLLVVETDPEYEDNITVEDFATKTYAEIVAEIDGVKNWTATFEGKDDTDLAAGLQVSNSGNAPCAVYVNGFDKDSVTWNIWEGFGPPVEEGSACAAPIFQALSPQSGIFEEYVPWSYGNGPAFFRASSGSAPEGEKFYGIELSVVAGGGGDLTQWVQTNTVNVPSCYIET